MREQRISRFVEVDRDRDPARVLEAPLMERELPPSEAAGAYRLRVSR